MFGVIPKTMWQRLIPADENNLIPMVTNVFILKAHGKNILFDIGLGDTLSEREMKVYGTDGQSQLEAGLKANGLTPEDIDAIILTHHAKHVKKKPVLLTCASIREDWGCSSAGPPVVHSRNSYSCQF